MDDRARLVAVAESYNGLLALRKEQRATMAKMLRACLAQLKSPDSRKRAEAIRGLENFAELLENEK